MRLFDTVNGKVIMNPASLWIPEFKTLWERDESVNKENAVKEISYVVFMYDFKSPYHAYVEREREVHILKDYIKDSKWRPDKKVKAAISKFKELQHTANSRLLEAAKIAADKLTDYFREIDSSSANDIVRNLKELAGVVKSLDALEKQVQREQLEANMARGGQDIGHFES